MPQDDRSQTYAGPVGTVVNIETVQLGNELGRLGHSGGAPADKAILAPTLLDRGPQRNPLIERLDVMLEAGATRPLLVVVPGGVEDLHQALVLRCALVDFDHYGGIGKWRYLKRLEWPEGAGNVEAILRTLRDALGQPKTYRQADIEQGIVDLGRHLCFSHFVDGERWRDDGGALVRKWVDYVAAGKPAPASGCLVVGFLCVVLAEPRNSACRKIEAYLDQLRVAHTAESSPIFVTKPLGVIRESHIGDWVAEVSRYLEDDVIEAELVDLPGTICPVQASPQRLAAVWGQLRDALARAVRRGARFAEGRP